MKPTIAIDARSYSGSQLYMGFVLYTNSIVNVLLEAGYEVTLLSNAPLNDIHEIVKKCKVKVFGSKRNAVWELRDVPRYLKANHHDLYFSGLNRGMYWGRVVSTRKILGLLDAIPFKLPKLYMTRFKFHFIRNDLFPQLISLWRADEIVTISKASKVDIEQLFKRKNVTFLPLIVTHVPTPKSTTKQKQFVYIGGENPRKRVDSLLRAFAGFLQQKPGYRLVLIGKGYETYADLMNELGISSYIDMPGYVSEAKKYQYIASSVAMVYPSLYEGYGLEIAEAILADIPVVTGEGGSSREVGGKAAIYIDPLSPQSITQGMEQALDPKVQAELRKQRAIQIKVIHDDSMKDVIISFFNKQVKLARSERDK